jgi:hypothetical protein
MNFEKLRLSEVLMYNTVKLICRDENNKGYLGTGFIFKYFRTDNDSVPVIVSNKHILNDAREIFVTLHASNEKNEPIPGTRSIAKIVINPELTYFLHHPDVDLSIFPFGKLINEELTEGRRPYYSGFDSSTIPSEQEWNNFNGLEEILLIGYPHGIMDTKNNYPIFVKGHTATHPNIDYNGFEEFLVNANAHPGSSGSPIILINESFINKSKNYEDYSRVKLLGILYRGFTVDFKGNIVENKIEQLYKNGDKYNIPTNICKIIKSTKLKYFESRLQKEIENIS